MNQRTTISILVIVIGALISGCVQQPKEEPSRPEVCPQVYKPVCGKDGQTYSNDCIARQKGVEISYQGECKEKPTSKCGDGVCDDIERRRNLCPADCGKPTTTTSLPKDTTTTIPEEPISSQESPFGFYPHGQEFYKAPGELADDETIDEVFNLIQKTGVKWIRYHLYWDHLEPNPPTSGVHDYKWDELPNDRIISFAGKHDIHVMLTIRSANEWVLPYWSMENPMQSDLPKDEYIDDYQDFVRAIMERYDGDGIDDALHSPKITHFEIENEIESNVFWRQGKDREERYAKLLTYASEIIKESNPSNKILISFANPKTGLHPSDPFFEDLVNYNNGEIVNKFDIVDLHHIGNGVFSEIENEIKDYEDVLTRYATSKEYWSTETVITSTHETDGYGGTEDKQAMDMIKIYVRFISSGWQRVMLRNFVDDEEKGNNKKPLDGIVNLDHTPKEAYYSYQTMVSKLDDFSFVQKLSEGQYKFMVNNKPVYVLWSDTGKGKVPDEISGTVKVTDYLGSEKIMEASAIQLSESPVFVEGSEESTEPPIFYQDLPFGGSFCHEKCQEEYGYSPNIFKEMDIQWVRHNFDLRFVRRDSPKDEIPWDRLDKQILEPQDYGLEIVMDIANTPKWAVSQDCEEVDTKRYYTCPPSEEYIEEFGDLIYELVERYDGDGVDDAPGHPVIKYWEIWNEPDFRAFFTGTASDYFRILKVAYTKAKKANPEAVILLGGIAGGDVTGDYDWFENLLSQENGKAGNYFDIMDYHAYNDLNIITDKASKYRSLLEEYGYEKPLWITESDSISFETKTHYTDESEQKQAEHVIKRHVMAYGAGVTRFCWYHLTDLNRPGKGEEDDCTYWEECSGFFRHDATKKPSYHTYKTMVSKLKGFSYVQKLSEGQYKFIVDNKPVYVLWSDAGTGKVPSEITGIVKVTDHLGNEQTMDASSIQLDESPVFVEEQ